MPKLIPPLKYYGGKHYLAKWIISFIPPHTNYIEPYFGGGAVLLNKDPEGISEIVNDIDGELTNFWRVLQNPVLFQQFYRKIEVMPFSQTEWNNYFKQSATKSLSVDLAIKFFVVCRQSMLGKQTSFSGITNTRTRRGMNEQVSAWLTAVSGLPKISQRLKRVLILNNDAMYVIKSRDNENTVFYLDPPYLPQTRITQDAYKYEMSQKDHEDLLDVITDVSIKGKMILSCYNNILYNSKLRNWNRKDLNIAHHASTQKTKKTMIESIWLNY
jgi:DNA adenine methylase